MSRTHEQCELLAFETQLVLQYFNDFQVIDPGGETRIEGWIRSEGGNYYKLQIAIPHDYPFSEPPLYIAEPAVLKNIDGVSINSLDASHAFHTHSNGPDGTISVCHVKRWDPSKNCVLVLMKGVLWCNLYELHLKTGKSINDLLEDLSAEISNFSRQ